MRILGLDYGEKRIGVAISDPLGITAQGLTVINYTSPDEAITRIKELCIEYDAKIIVIGNPINMDGSRGISSEKAEEFSRKLEEHLSINVDLIDERLTSISAEKTLLEGDVSRSKRKKVKDKLAAALILELYMAKKSNEKNEV